MKFNNKIDPKENYHRGNFHSPKFYDISAGNFLPSRHLPFNYEKVKVYHGKVNNCDYWRPKVNYKFDPVRSNNFGKTQHTGMEQNLENYDFGLNDANGKILKKNTDIKSHKCNQCDYASSIAGNLSRHLKTHSGEKSNKCNQCDYASSQVGHLRRHLKTHNGE